MRRSEEQDRKLEAILDRARRVLRAMEAGEIEKLDMGTRTNPDIILLNGADDSVLGRVWRDITAELKDIVRTSQHSCKFSHQLIEAVRRCAIAMESGDIGVLRYRVDTPQPKQPTGVLADDPIFRLWEGIRNELHLAVTLAVSRQTMEEFLADLRRVYEANAERLARDATVKSE